MRGALLEGMESLANPSGGKCWAIPELCVEQHFGFLTKRLREKEFRKQSLCVETRSLV